MAASDLGLDVGVSSTSWTAGLRQKLLPPAKGSLILVQELYDCCSSGALQSLTTVWSRQSHSISEFEEIVADRVPEAVWQQLFTDPTQWWDNRPTWAKDVSGGGFHRLAAEHKIRACRQACEDGPISDAVDALDLLVQRGFHVDNYLFYCVLRRCIAHKNVILGRRIHALTVTCGYEANAFLATHLMSLYASQGHLQEAMDVFAKVSTPSPHNWATIILAYARNGEPLQAIRLYRMMRELSIQPGNHIFVAVLKACAAGKDLIAGKDVHCHIRASGTESNVFVQNSLVDMYAKCGSIEDARQVFDEFPHKNLVTWTTMVAGYVQQGMAHEAIRLYETMQQHGIIPDSVAFVCLLQACASVGEAAQHLGMHLHAQIDQQELQDNVVVGASLVNMYAKCGRMEDACQVFHSLPRKNVVTWNALISAYAQHSMGHEALSLYSSMQRDRNASPDSVTFVCLLQACASMGDAALPQGKQIQLQVEERGLQADVTVGNSLVNMYSKCGSLEDARRVFNSLPKKNVVTWTAIIAGYAQQGMGQEALDLYSRMQQEGMTSPDALIYVSLLQACATLAALPLGRHLHAEIDAGGMQADVVVGTGLVNMYAKCGSMVDAQQVFDSLPEPDVVAWGCLIAGYARQGDSAAVFKMLDRMRQEGVQPNAITFLSALTVCTHAGLVDKGRECFHSMRADFGITPTSEHYTCMMDLLGRAGYLDEALKMAKAIRSPPNAAMWLSLLGACQKWNNVEIGQQAFESAVCIDGTDSSPYALMSNIYAGSQMWKEAREMHVMRVKAGALKNAGRSWWTDMGGVVHVFGHETADGATRGVHA